MDEDSLSSIEVSSAGSPTSESFAEVIAFRKQPKETPQTDSHEKRTSYYSSEDEESEGSRYSLTIQQLSQIPNTNAIPVPPEVQANDPTKIDGDEGSSSIISNSDSDKDEDEEDEDGGTEEYEDSEAEEGEGGSAKYEGSHQSSSGPTYKKLDSGSDDESDDDLYTSDEDNILKEGNSNISPKEGVSLNSSPGEENANLLDEDDNCRRPSTEDDNSCNSDNTSKHSADEEDCNSSQEDTNVSRVPSGDHYDQPSHPEDPDQIHTSAKNRKPASVAENNSYSPAETHNSASQEENPNPSTPTPSAETNETLPNKGTNVLTPSFKFELYSSESEEEEDESNRTEPPVQTSELPSTENSSNSGTIEPSREVPLHSLVSSEVETSEEEAEERDGPIQSCQGTVDDKAQLALIAEEQLQQGVLKGSNPGDVSVNLYPSTSTLLHDPTSSSVHKTLGMGGNLQPQPSTSNQSEQPSTYNNKPGVGWNIRPQSPTSSHSQQPLSQQNPDGVGGNVQHQPSTSSQSEQPSTHNNKLVVGWNIPPESPTSSDSQQSSSQHNPVGVGVNSQPQPSTSGCSKQPSSQQNSGFPIEPQRNHPPTHVTKKIFQPEDSKIQSQITQQLYTKLNQSPYGEIALFFVYHGTQSTSSGINSKNSGLQGSWKWDDPSFVQLPLSSRFGQWDTIVTNLVMLRSFCEEHEPLKKNPTLIGKLFRQALAKYQKNPTNFSNFEILSRQDISTHIVSTLPKIIHHALQLPLLLSKPIPILEKGHSKTIYLTKKLCCSLLANAFLCTFPEPRISMGPPWNFNFYRLFNSETKEKADVKAEKIMCILNYFHQMTTIMDVQENFSEKVEDSIISFERRCERDEVKWSSSTKSLSEVQVDPQGKIEEKLGMLHVDFANKLVGGGVLNDGSVMEEIRFCICPELLVSRLFTQELGDDEVLVIKGTQQFSKYEGYASTFKFLGADNQLSLEKDDYGRMKTEIVAMDATQFRRFERAKQYKKEFMDRELHKAFVGFKVGPGGITPAPVATGNWGCGAFNGDPEMKFFIQWMAASECGRPLCYHTIGDSKQSEEIKGMVRYLRESGVGVRHLYKIVEKFDGEHFHCDSVFDFVVNCVKARVNTARKSQFKTSK